jgi:hypothetical protein
MLTDKLACSKSRGRVLGVLACLLLCCSCATRNSIGPGRPAETSFNKGAGRGDPLEVKLRLESGEELLFMVDTEACRTILDKSLEPKLGKRLGTRMDWTFTGTRRAGLYMAPKLYLGRTQLLTGGRVLTEDIGHPPIMGILGMDCLRHYCLQLDFTSAKMRFLDPDGPNNEDLGRAFPLTLIFGNPLAHGDFWGEGNKYFFVDTGCVVDFDAFLSPRLFQRKLKEQKPDWDGFHKTPAGKLRRMAGFSKSNFGGRTYNNVILWEWSGPGSWPVKNLLGLRFLARNLVTFNFPKRTMYLKQIPGQPAT